MSLSRRGLFRVLTGAVAAPYVAKHGLLMPVKSIVEPRFYEADFATAIQTFRLVPRPTHILTSSQFRALIEPILSKEFDRVYASRADEWGRVLDERTVCAGGFHREPRPAGD